MPDRRSNRKPSPAKCSNRHVQEIAAGAIRRGRVGGRAFDRWRRRPGTTMMMMRPVHFQVGLHGGEVLLRRGQIARLQVFDHGIVISRRLAVAREGVGARVAAVGGIARIAGVVRQAILKGGQGFLGSGKVSRLERHANRTETSAEFARPRTCLSPGRTCRDLWSRLGWRGYSWLSGLDQFSEQLGQTLAKFTRPARKRGRKPRPTGNYNRRASR